MALLLELGFPEGSGTTTADSSGNGRDCTVGPAAWATGHTGGGVAPNNANTVTFPALGSGGSTFTIMGWVRRTGAPGSGTTVCNVGTSSSARWNMQNDGSITALSAHNTGVIPESTWTHVAFVADGATARTCYVNGVSVSADSGQQAFISASATYALTSNATAYLQWDDFRIYDNALTQGEVETAMNTPVASGGPEPITGTLVADLPTVTVGPPTAAISGTVSAPAVVGELSATLPAVEVGPPTFAMSGTVTVPTYSGDLAASAPEVIVGPPTVAWEGTVSAPVYTGSLDATLPEVTIGAPKAEITGSIHPPNGSAMMAMLPPVTIGPPTFAMSGTVTAPTWTGDLEADLPTVTVGAPTFAMVGTVTAPTITGALVATLPTVTIGPPTIYIRDEAIAPLPVDGVTLDVSTDGETLVVTPGTTRSLKVTTEARDLEVST